jgi:chromosome segregation ATPase
MARDAGTKQVSATIPQETDEEIKRIVGDGSKSGWIADRLIEAVRGSDEVERLRQENTALADRVRDLQAGLDRVTAERDQAVGRAGTLQQEVETLTAQARDAQDDLARTRETLEDLRERERALIQEGGALQVAATKAEGERDALQAVKERIEAERDNLWRLVNEQQEERKIYLSRTPALPPTREEVERLKSAGVLDRIFGWRRLVEGLEKESERSELD